MSNLIKIVSTLFCTSIFMNVNADETFVQDGTTYLLKSKSSEKSPNQPMKRLVNAVSKEDAEDLEDGKLEGLQETIDQNKENKYRLVYKLEKDSETSKVSQTPALFTNLILVEAKDLSLIKTDLTFKESFELVNYHVYELPDGKKVATALEELSKQPGVKSVHAEIIEHFNIPM